MKGLEISIINKSALDFIKRRLDAEYYKKEYLLLDEKIKEFGKVNLKEINAILDCSAFYPSITEYYDFNGEGVPFIRVNEIKDGLLNISESTAFLPQQLLDDNKSTICIGYANDIIIAKGGNSLAKVGLLNSSYSKYAMSRDIILLRTSTLKNYDRFFLWIFFHSKFGQALLWRTASQTGQPHLTLPSINEIFLPKANSFFVEKIKILYERSVENKTLSKQKYSQAENLLLETLNLWNFQPFTDAINVKSLKESFLNSGRLDAEYYQLKYESYINLIKHNELGFSKLENVCNLKDKNFNPKDEVHYKYIELSNIGKSGDITGNTFDLGKELPSRARRLVNTGDVIISSIEGSLESCALVTEQYDKAICSTGFYVINSNKINSETLLVLFKSELMQNILKQNCSGTILTAINKNEFLSIPIPFIKNNIQDQIATLVKESFTLKSESEKLLETAKRAVEITVEENEDLAMSFINQNI
ncbi:restriction endonuclease subunit S [Elizabethkingia anophelis]|uniref:restriction endonuclease subunit S n=1 Tax=Elizabethkingia anophelis TaxID=1117645 RepID=UPI000A43C1E5|nr:restriction endonuclease subunit S [Elizabethkingia anophelis]